MCNICVQCCFCSPVENVIILSPPAPVIVGKAIYLQVLLFAQGWNASKVLGIWQAWEDKMKFRIQSSPPFKGTPGKPAFVLPSPPPTASVPSDCTKQQQGQPRQPSVWLSLAGRQEYRFPVFFFFSSDFRLSAPGSLERMGHCANCNIHVDSP